MRKQASALRWPRRNPVKYRFALPNDVWCLGLKPAEFMILSCICWMRNLYREDRNAEVETVARTVHLTAATVAKHLDALVEKGLLTPERSLTSAIRCETRGNFFSLPNEVFLLGLPPSAFSVYAYLLCCENRRTHKCHPSYTTIAAATRTTVKTVMKAVGILLDKSLIFRERTAYFDERCMKQNGNNLYTILQVQSAVDGHYAYHLAELALAARTPRRQPRAALCAPFGYTEGNCPPLPGKGLKGAV